MVLFLPYLTPYESSLFTQAIFGVVLGYTIELKLKGIGYRVRKEEEKLIFSLGYSCIAIRHPPVSHRGVLTLTVAAAVAAIASAPP